MTWNNNDVNNWFSEQGVAGKWHRMYESETDSPDEHFFRLRRDFTISLVADKLDNGSRILDFGCGAGPIITTLKQKGYGCLGLDYSHDMLRYARQRLLEQGFDGRILLRGDCGRAPFQDNSFDCIVCLGVISYLKDYRPVLSEIMRMLTPNGLAIISFRNKFNPVFSDPVLTGKYLIKRAINRCDEEPEHLGRFLDPGTVRSNIAEAGLNVVNVKGIGFGPFSIGGKRLLSGKRTIAVSDGITRWLSRLGLMQLATRLTDVNIFVCHKPGVAIP